MRIIGGAIILVIAVWLYVVSTRMVNKDKKENHTGCDGNCAGCIEPASRPLHAFQIQMGIPSTLCMNRSIFMANSSNAFLSKHTVSITIRFYVDTSNSYHPEKRSLVVPV